MRHLRALVRLAFLSALTLAMYLVFLGTRPSKLFSHRGALASQAWCFRTWARGVARIVAVRITVEGAPPPPPFFLVSNHLSYLDVIALATCTPCFFVAKKEVANWPVLGFLARSMDTVFVDRTRRGELPGVLAGMERILRAGHGLAFFPEGTSSPGEAVLPFRSSLFEAPVSSGYPICCASLRYETRDEEPPARLAVCWWGDMTFAGHFYEMLQLSRFEAWIAFGETVTGHDRKELASAAWSAVTRVFVATSAPERTA